MFEWLEKFQDNHPVASGVIEVTAFFGSLYFSGGTYFLAARTIAAISGISGLIHGYRLDGQSRNTVVNHPQQKNNDVIRRQLEEEQQAAKDRQQEYMAKLAAENDRVTEENDQLKGKIILFANNISARSMAIGQQDRPSAIGLMK